MISLQIIEYKNQRILTTSQLAEKYEVDQQLLINNFNRNKSRYKEGKHYIALTGKEKRDFIDQNQIDLSLKNAHVLYLWTEKGAWMHAKSLNTDKAWDAYESLVDDYYRKNQQLSQLEYIAFLVNHAVQKEKEDARRDQEIKALQHNLTLMKETFLHRDKEWREWINRVFAKAVLHTEHKDFQATRNATYEELETRARCDLKVRLRNLKARLEEQGATKTQLEKTTRLDVIEADPRLKEIYTTIIKELSLRYVPVGAQS